MAAACPSCSRPDQPPSSSSSSTPFVSAPSSPPFSTLASYSSQALPRPSDFCSSDFDFSARFSEVEYWPPASMSSAEELFHNGRIRPLLSHRLPDAWTQPSSNSCPRRLHGVDDISSYSHACGRCDAAAPRDYDHGSVYDLCECCEGSMDRVESNFSAPFSSPQSSPSHEAMSPRAGEPRASALEQWKKSKVQLQAQGSIRRSNHPRRSDEMVDARRVARAAQSSSEPRIQRRARSLSPLRVFSDTKHVGQVQQRRQSVDGGTKAAPRAATSKDRKRRSGRKSWTLKELLYIGDTRVHESSTSNAHEAAESGKARERRARSIRPQNSSRKLAVAASHEASGMHFCGNGGGGIGQTRTSSSYLPAHEHVGLVGCIGFFSKSCSSLKGAGLAHVHHPRHA